MTQTNLLSNSAKITDIRGFTLVELMITLVISTMIIASISVSYVAQQKSQVVQDQVIEMQQNLRAAMLFLSSEVRMAGYKPPGVNFIKIPVSLPPTKAIFGLPGIKLRMVF